MYDLAHHMVGVLGFNKGGKGIDPLLDAASVSACLARLVQDVPREDGGVLLVQQTIVCVPPAHA